MKYFKLLLKLSFVVLLAWCVGLLWFINSIPSQVDDKTTITDGIVALTGGSSRVPTALKLLKEKKAKKLLITGVGEGINFKNLGINTVNERNITLGYIAKDTRQNAQEAAIWTQLEEFNSIRIVTANYHIPRSTLEFKKTMPDITIIPHPVFPKTVKVKGWWHFPGSAKLIISEYNKFLGSYTQHSFMDMLHCLSTWSAKILDN